MQPREREREREQRLSFEKQFYKERYNRAKGTQAIYGFPIVKGAWCNSKLKMSALRKIEKSYIGESVLHYPEQTERPEIPQQANGLPLAPQSSVVQQISKGKPFEGGGFSASSVEQGAVINTVQYLGIAADEPERIERHTKPGMVLPLVDIGWNEAYCRQWCEENDLLSPIYTTAARGGCWFCHNQGVDQLRLLRRNYPHLWKLLLKWDNDSPVSFHPDGHTVHDFDKRFQAEDDGLIKPNDKKFRWKQVLHN